MDQNNSQSAGFRWTTQPFMDFGVQTLMTLAKLPDEATPEDLTTAQLEEWIDKAALSYLTRPDLYKSVILIFGVNFLNPSWKPAQQEANVRRYLRAFLNEPNPELPECTFFKRPSVGEAARDTFPMLMGRDNINFYPGHGQPSLAVSGQAFTAIQAIIFGALRCQGKLTIVETDDPTLRRDIVRVWVARIQSRIELSKLGKEVEDLGSPKTNLINTLVDIAGRQAETVQPSSGSRQLGGGGGIAKYRGSATIYHFSNSGQGPSLDIYTLAAPVLSFVQIAQSQSLRPAWSEIRRRWWPKPKVTKKDAPLPEDYELPPTQQGNSSNRFFNDLFNLPNDTAKFIRIYFLQTMRSLVEKSLLANPQRQLMIALQVRALWDLTEYFLEEVLQMQQSRIADIKQLCDRMADLIMADRPKYKQVLMVRRNWPAIRQLIRQFNRRETDNGRAPILKLDQFLSIFEMGEEAEYVDWALAWDLVLIRLMEVLYERGFFKEMSEEDRQDLDKVEADEAALTTV